MEGNEDRCSQPGHSSWEHYGGRRITVCDRWQEFKNFLADMGERPEGTSLDRIDNEGNYEPGNLPMGYGEGAGPESPLKHR